MIVFINEALKGHTLQELDRIPGLEIITDPEDPRTVGTEVLVGAHNKQLVERMPQLKLVQLLSAGSGDLSDIPDEIPVANAYGAYGKGIAEYLLTATLMFQKNFPMFMERQRERIWNRDTPLYRVAGTKVLSVGMGAIGTEYLRLCSMLGMECYGVRRTLHDQPDFVKKLYTMDTMDEILPMADFVVLSMPHTPETAGAFHEARFRKMKKDAVLINVGRGTAVVTDDLLTVMKDGWFRGVLLDVMEQEPLPLNSPLWTAERVVLTPHIAGRWTSPTNYEAVMSVVKENLQRFLDGKPLLHTIDRKLAY
ncbi:MAG: D-2-hydroxyacid dehydrogenase [Erysipelotrichaceae bacterium]|nr:D-2-hydroxyacid dehydrogenase [Erysipelotrichaceae bacterium]